MSTDDKKALVQHYIEEACNRGNLAIIDKVISPDYNIARDVVHRAGLSAQES